VSPTATSLGFADGAERYVLVSAAAPATGPRGVDGPTRPLSSTAMGTLVRLRIVLADVPGSLARAAAVIAEYGANITAIDIQQGGSSSAVDEVTIELDDMAQLAELRRQLGDSGSARVVSHQVTTPVDPVVRVLQRLVHVLRATSYDRDEQLRLGVAELCALPTVWVGTAGEAGAYLAGRLALERPGAAVVVRTTELPESMAVTLSGEAWLLAVTNSAPGDGQRVVFVGRPVTHDFTVTETGRIEALMAVHEHIEALLAPR